MNKLTQRLLIATSAALLVGASTVAMARGGQDCDPMGGMNGMGGMSGMNGEMPKGPRAEKMHARMGAQFAKQQAALKARLKLTADQEGAWTVFTTAMTPPNMANMTRMNHADMQALTTPQRIEKMQAMKTERDTQMTKRLEATKAFYSTLTPEQQKVFDTQSLRGMLGGQGGQRGNQQGGQRQG